MWQDALSFPHPCQSGRTDKLLQISVSVAEHGHVTDGKGPSL